MPIIMKLTSIISIILTILFVVLFNYYGNEALYTLAITFGTISYHFIMRLMVGYILNAILKNNVNYNKKWFKVSETEMKIYKVLKVKKWKDRMPTFDPEVFDPSKHSWDEILMAMCQSEVVHETIFVFSFLPIIATIWFDSLMAFLITSIISGLFDLAFVIMQRFNRARILRVKSRL